MARLRSARRATRACSTLLPGSLARSGPGSLARPGAGRSLAIKVSNCKYRGVIDKCTVRGEVFYGCSPQFLNALLMKLKLVFYMPNEEIFKKDDLSRQLALVLKGACHLMEDDKVKRIVRDDVSECRRVLRGACSRVLFSPPL